MNKAALHEAAITGNVDVRAIEDGQWFAKPHGEIKMWLRGYVEGTALSRLLDRLTQPGIDPLLETKAILGNVSGHFAIIVCAADWTIVAVDWVRSIPLFYARRGHTWVIDDRAERLRRTAGFDGKDVDPDAALAFAMAGYTIDRATIYRGLEMLGPGECVLFQPPAAPRRERYYTYRPWHIRERDGKSLQTELRETTLDIIERMLSSLHGRTLIVPLSAGYDSRLIVSAAKQLGFKNLRCFSYGRAGNFEITTSRAIAEQLGYPWAFVPLTIGGQREFFGGELHRRYLDYADTCASVPFIQDMSAILALKERGFIPQEAVIANGNSGDYISGMHISPALRRPPAAGLGLAARKIRILNALVDKHFALWESLSTPANLERIGALLWRSIENAGGALEDPACDHGLYEYAEFQDRQCKYVVTGQRIYEFLGHEWRLPLWDNAYLRFWEGVPLAEKAHQALYSRMLREANWGGVWREVPVNRKTIRPSWIAPVRYAAKLAHVPAGTRRWHRFERRFLQYWMDITCNSAVVPYGRVACDKRGARHAVSWLAEECLAAKGITMSEITAGVNLAHHAGDHDL